MFDGPEGTVRLADLFEGRPQLIIYHFMFDPEWDDGCPSCTAGTDEISAGLPRPPAHRGTPTYALVSRAPLEKLERWKQKQGWDLPWYSSYGSDFNYDFGVTDRRLGCGRPSTTSGPRPSTRRWARTSARPSQPFEMPGRSCFLQVDGRVFHTYSQYARGLESTGGSYYFLDLTALGRQEDWEEPKGRSDVRPGRPARLRLLSGGYRGWSVSFPVGAAASSTRIVRRRGRGARVVAVAAAVVLGAVGVTRLGSDDGPPPPEPPSAADAYLTGAKRLLAAWSFSFRGTVRAGVPTRLRPEPAPVYATVEGTVHLPLSITRERAVDAAGHAVEVATSASSVWARSARRPASLAGVTWAAAAGDPDADRLGLALIADAIRSGAGARSGVGRRRPAGGAGRPAGRRRRAPGAVPALPPARPGAGRRPGDGHARRGRRHHPD